MAGRLPIHCFNILRYHIFEDFPFKRHKKYCPSLLPKNKCVQYVLNSIIKRTA